MSQLYSYRSQPWKGLYLVYQFFTTVFFRFPYWLVTSDLPNRPRQSWTLKKSVCVKFLRHLVDTVNQTGDCLDTPNHLAITPGEGVKGVWVEPTSDLIAGTLKNWADLANVVSIRIPGYWTHKEGTPIIAGFRALPGEKIVYMLHGGGYTRLSAHPSNPISAISQGLLKHVDSVSRVFAIEYRLASGEPFEAAHPFPTQLIDALAGYNYLVNTLGFDANNIIVVGDSAGGNLAHALTQYLVDYQDAMEIDLPNPPGSLVLLSPWLDLSNTMYLPQNGSHETNIDSDYIGGREISYSKWAFLGPNGPSAAENNHYISPACLLSKMKVDFKRFPRTFINAGGAEVLRDSIRVYRDRIVQELGEGDGVREGEGRVRYFEMPDGTHDYLAFDWFEPERTTTLKEINRWVGAASIETQTESA